MRSLRILLASGGGNLERRKAIAGREDAAGQTSGGHARRGLDVERYTQYRSPTPTQGSVLSGSMREDCAERGGPSAPVVHTADAPAKLRASLVEAGEGCVTATAPVKISPIVEICAVGKRFQWSKPRHSQTNIESWRSADVTSGSTIMLKASRGLRPHPRGPVVAY
jgi:hypothetical protein